MGKKKNNYNIIDIISEMSRINPKTGRANTQDDVVKILGYTDRTTMLRWIKTQGYEIYLVTPALYGYRKREVTSK